MKALIGGILTRLHGKEKYNMLWISCMVWMVERQEQLRDIADKVDTYVEVSTPSPA